MIRIVQYVLADILKNRIMLAYTLFMLVVSLTVFSLEDNTSKGLLTLLNLVLFIVPMVSIIFSTIYMYNSAEFIELLVSQPLKRQQIWLSLFAGLSGSLLLAFLVGIGLPVILFDGSYTGLYLIVTGGFLSLIFCALAVLASVVTRDKAKGIGISLLFWLYFTLLFDGLVLFALFQFADYPLEKILLVVSLLNPVDLARILVLLELDFSALMGYTGAVFREFLGNKTGVWIGISALLIWVLLPLYISVRKFNRMDL